MEKEKTVEKQRQRAPSARALATRARILDAAERVFADQGFAGATLRDIAKEADTQVGLVHHHGHGKEELFRQTIERRADVLARLRRESLLGRKAAGPMTLPAIFECFFGPYLHLAETGGAQWRAYARLVAHVSADPHWRDISAAHFDPTAALFIGEIIALHPHAPRDRVASGFVYSVSAMLALLTSQWRIDTLGAADAQTNAADTKKGGAGHSPLAAQSDLLVTFCAAGMAAALAETRDPALPRQ